MQGHNKVYGLIMIIIFIVAFNFCRKAIRRDRDLRKQRDETLRLKLQEELILQKFEIEKKLQEQEIQRQNEIAVKLKEHKDVCYDLFIFSMNPKFNFEPEPINNNKINANNKRLNSKAKNSGKKDDLKIKNSVSEPIIYLFVLVLIYFLMKAASDLSQHYKKKSEEKSNRSRRCSLKSYAERKNSKAHFTRQSSFDLRSKSIIPIEEEKKIYQEQFNQIGGMRISENKKNEFPSLPTVLEKIPEIGTTNNLRHQLIRRSSMPLFTRMNSLTEAKFRRSSMDILNSEEGSPRRVRMIHRH